MAGSYHPPSEPAIGGGEFFVGREKQISELRSVFDQRRHLVISGSAGMGKSTLLKQIGKLLPVLVCKETSVIEDCCTELATQLNLQFTAHSIDERIARVASTIQRTSRTVAFDPFDQPSPGVVVFIGQLTNIVPVWIVTRSTSSQGFGSVAEQFREFAHLEVGPLKRTDVRMLIARAVVKQVLRSSAVDEGDTFYHLCHGNPRILERLLSFVMIHKPEGHPALKHCFDLWKKSKDRAIHCPEFP